ncbi:regulatory protein [Streptococcus varani]|jgi:hypothetical protein|uniref:Regulatory protein n=2 Tax=Streptococcus varani TaxID=1608583 RepID=A0A0E4CSQ1_9STRE|nr:PTS sugar transporter subunit IIC [Streptococcus varani]CQR24806.1 regulatory protein [Streptococcus varani]
MTQTSIKPSEYFSKVLTGTAMGVIIGVAPNAVLSAILRALPQVPVTISLLQIVSIFQMATPFLVGAIVAFQFGFKPLTQMVVAASSFIASGVLKFDDSIGKFAGAGTGDLINTMITAAIAVGMILLIKDKFGSMEIIAMPVVIGVLASFIGLTLLPIVSGITLSIGAVINSFTSLQPILMSILIAVSFAALLTTPVSAIAVGLAIQLSGVASGAAAMGVAATTLTLVVHSFKVNKPGITIAVGTGGMKLMMPNLFKYPIVLLPYVTTAAISAIPVYLFSISGTPQTAGFGVVGLVSPLASIDAGLSIPLAVLSWLVVPVAAAMLSQFVYDKVLHIYDSKVVFKYLGQ